MLDMTGGLDSVGVHAENVDSTGLTEPRRLEGRQGAGRLEATVIGDDDRVLRAGLSGYHDQRRGAFFKTFLSVSSCSSSRDVKRK